VLESWPLFENIMERITTMKKSQSGAQTRRETVLPDNAIYAAMGAMAAVIEEPHCAVGADELRQLVHAHNRLYRAIGCGEPDYRYRDGAVFARHGGSEIKRAVGGADAS
jgi:hypothetical protein